MLMVLDLNPSAVHTGVAKWLILILMQGIKTDTCNVGFTFVDLETIFLLKVPKSFLFDEMVYTESSPFLVNCKLVPD